MSTNTKTTILIKTDKKVKAAVQRVAREMGVPLSTLTNVYYKKLARERRVVLEAPLVPTPKAARWIREARKEWEEGKVPRFNSLEEMFKDLDRD